MTREEPSPVFYSRRKHIQLKYHYICELVDDGTLSLRKIAGYTCSRRLSHGQTEVMHYLKWAQSISSQKEVATSL